MNAKEEIQKLVDTVAKTLVDSVPGYKIDRPVDETHGDISVNIAFLLAKQLKKSPQEIGAQIKTEIEKQKPEFIEKVEMVGGYINFWLSKDIFISQLQDLLKGSEKVVVTAKMDGKKVMVEYTDPNPFKEFHIGHLYSNAVGEAISRLLEAGGAEVWRANYQGDVGMHIAKSIYGILRISNLKSQISNMETKTPKERAEFLGECYAKGAKVYEEDEKAKQEINEINKKIYEKSDPKIQSLYEKGRAWSLEYFETLYKRLGTKFDVYYFESEVGPIGSKIVKEYQEKGIFEKSEGAIIFPGEKYGLHNRVFINSLGLPTYEAKELGLNKKKYEDYPFDLSVIVTGNEINEYFKVLFKAMEMVLPEVAAKTKHVGHGMVRLPQGKMSSRSGNVITGEWLLDEAKRRAASHAGASAIASSQKDSIGSPSAALQNDNEVAEQVAIAAVKYTLLKSSIGRDIEFDFDSSISMEGNSGPYLQYTYVRTRSILQKYQISNIKYQINTNKQKDWKFEIGNLKLEIEELSLLRTLAQFPEVVEEAGEKLAPHIVCNYLYNLAQKFNNFYQKYSILNPGRDDIRQFRLQLTQGVGIVIKKGLYLLGIQTPERM